MTQYFTRKLQDIYIAPQHKSKSWPIEASRKIKSTLSDPHWPLDEAQFPIPHCPLDEAPVPITHRSLIWLCTRPHRVVRQCKDFSNSARSALCCSSMAADGQASRDVPRQPRKASRSSPRRGSSFDSVCRACCACCWRESGEENDGAKKVNRNLLFLGTGEAEQRMKAAPNRQSNYSSPIRIRPREVDSMAIVQHAISLLAFTKENRLDTRQRECFVDSQEKLQQTSEAYEV